MISYVTVSTAKLEETVEFYQWLLGLPIVARLKEPTVEIVFLGDNETKFELIGDPKAEMINTKGISIGFAVDSLEEKMAMLDEKKIRHGKVISPAPNVRFFFFTDLNGCVIQLVEESK